MRHFSTETPLSAALLKNSAVKLHIKQERFKFLCQVCDVRIEAVCMAVSSGA